MARNQPKIYEPSERKALPMFVQQIENEREVIALNALFGNIDDGYDILHPGAFAKTLLERFHRVRVLWQHAHWLPPVGVPKWAKEIGRDELPDEVLSRFPEALGGLLSKIEYLNTDRGNEMLVGIKAEAIIENSIGYDPVVYDFEETEDGHTVRNLREVRLWDLSPVNWGMNEGAVMLGFKGLLPYVDLPIASADTPWDPTAAAERVAAWAAKDGGVDWNRYRRAFLMRAREASEEAAAYKLLVADVVDDRLVIVPQAIYNAALEAERQGLDEAKEHLGRYFHKLQANPPWEGEKARAWAMLAAALNAPEPEQMAALLDEFKAGGVVTSLERAVPIWSALMEFAGEAGEPDENGPEGKNDQPPVENPLDAMSWRLKLLKFENNLNL